MSGKTESSPLNESLSGEAKEEKQEISLDKIEALFEESLKKVVSDVDDLADCLRFLVEIIGRLPIRTDVKTLMINSPWGEYFS